LPRTVLCSPEGGSIQRARERALPRTSFCSPRSGSTRPQVRPPGINRTGAANIRSFEDERANQLDQMSQQTTEDPQTKSVEEELQNYRLHTLLDIVKWQRDESRRNAAKLEDRLERIDLRNGSSLAPMRGSARRRNAPEDLRIPEPHKRVQFGPPWGAKFLASAATQTSRQKRPRSRRPKSSPGHTGPSTPQTAGSSPETDSD
jgi:hypothetical protein